MKRSPPVYSQRTGKATPVSRTERLLAVINHCRTAKTLADDLGDKFLAYMLAMTLEEANSALRREQETQRANVRGSKAGLG